MIQILLLLELLVLLILLRNKLGLLLLVLLIHLRVPSTDGGRHLVGLELAGMYRWIAGARNVCARRSTIGRRMIRRARFSGGDDAFSLELCRLGSCSDWRPAVIHRSAKLRIGARSLDMLDLRRHRWNMPCSRRRLFCWGRTRRNATLSTVITDPVHRRTVNHRGVVDVVNDGDVHITHGAIVEKLSAIPPSTLETNTEKAETIADSAVEPDLWTPVALMEQKSAAAPTPIPGGPEEADLRGFHPCSRHPVVIAEIVVVSPVAGRPQIIFAGTNRLLVNGQRRRPKRNGYTDLRKRCGRREQHRQDDQHIADGMIGGHRASSKGRVEIYVL